MKSVIAIWAATLIVSVATFTYVEASINQRVQHDKMQEAATAYELQPAERGTKLQMTVSGESLQYGDNPQETINGKDLQGGR